MKKFWFLSFVAVSALVSGGAASAASNAPRAAGQAGVLDSDFNGDGYQDLVVGIPGRDINYQGITQNEAAPWRCGADRQPA